MNLALIVLMNLFLFTAMILILSTKVLTIKLLRYVETKCKSVFLYFDYFTWNSDKNIVINDVLANAVFSK